MSASVTEDDQVATLLCRTGHWARECRKSKKDKSKEGKLNQDGASSHASTKHELFWSSGHVNQKDTKYIDSGASQHMNRAIPESKSTPLRPFSITVASSACKRTISKLKR